MGKKEKGSAIVSIFLIEGKKKADGAGFSSMIAVRVKKSGLRIPRPQKGGEKRLRT